MSLERIVIIGGGAAGAWMLLRLLQAGHRHIDIVEPREGLGHGVAYSTPSDRHHLNVPVHKMDMLAEGEDPLFMSWLERNAPEFSSDGYPPRRLYGRFLQETVAQASAGKDVHHHRTQALAITETDLGLAVALADGGALSASSVILALGNLPPAPLAPGNADPRIIEAPWTLPAETVASRDRVIIAGTGLTALDAVVSIAGVNPQAYFTLAAAHPLLPPCDRIVTPWADGEAAIGRSPGAIWSMARRAIRNHPDPLGWYEIIDGLRPHVEEIWAGWSNAQRKSFLSHAARRWLHHRHRTPPPTWQKIASLIEAGRLSLRAGRIRGLSATAASIEVGFAAEIIPADLVVNATGPNMALGSHPLLRQALAAGLILECPLGLGIAVDDSGRCLVRGKTLSRLFALGTLTRGQFFETVAVPHIRKYAGKIAAAISSPVIPAKAGIH